MRRLEIGMAFALTAAACCYAGETLSDYQTLTGSGALQRIVGQFGEGDYAALYRIHIANPATFTATAVNSVTGSLDTRLYLFTLAGAGIAGNDDATATEVRSTLPPGNALYASLVPGDYLLGISTFATAPYGSDDIAVISDFINGVNGPDPSGNSRLAYWGHDLTSNYGPYEIDLAGVSYVTAVKLDVTTTPSSGIGGVSFLNVTAAGVPPGVVRPENVLLSFAAACGAAPLAVVPASSAVRIIGTSYRIHFQIPAGLPSRSYFVRVQDDGAGDANFVSGNCSQVAVAN
jgi:hypothetical protein